jgi:cytochrome c5
MSQEQDKIFFKNFSLTLTFIAAMMIAFYFVANAAVQSKFGLVAGDTTTVNTNVAELTEPVGRVVIAGEESESVAAEDVVVADVSTTEGTDGSNGESVYNGLCVNCHGIAALAAMIPQTGDTAAWGPRIGKGVDVLYGNAINGYTGELGMMPAKGGNPALSDEEVKAAVDYIVGQVK